MPARRFRPIQRKVTFSFDGEPIEAEDGEPIAASLLAAGIANWTRSPKYHRPRGPYCFARNCEGCLARVDGEPNLFSCHVRAREGVVVGSQNHVGPKRADLLRLADWMFPNGVDHHDVFADLPLVPRILPSLARRIVGLGTLPTASPNSVRAERSVGRRDADVVVVGSGPFGMAAALAFADEGRAVEVKEMRIELGGSARYDAASFDGLFRDFGAAVDAGRIRVDGATCVSGVYEGELLCVGVMRTELVRPRLGILATGTWESAALFADNDAPGVLGVRAALELALLGVAAGERITAVVTGGDGQDSAHLVSLLRGSGSHVDVIAGTPLRAEGRPVRSVRVQTERGEEEFVTDAVVLDGVRAPAFTLAEQAGHPVVRTTGGFAAARLSHCAGFEDRFVCVGEVAGSNVVSEVEARRCARAIARAAVV